jgi:hypothetical protein
MLIQAFLIVAALGALLLLLRSRASARSRAWKKLIMVALTGVAVVSILRPEITTTVANAFGVGRGTDFLLYLFIAVFLYVATGFYLRFRDFERQVTILARRVALDEAPGIRGSAAAEDAAEHTGPQAGVRRAASVDKDADPR